MRIAMLGTRGVPARYGGFETCVEEVGCRLVSAGHDVTVYCRVLEGQVAQRVHKGMRLVTLPAVRTRSLETLSHTAASVAHLVTRARPDVVIMFNAANAPLLPLLRSRRVPVATHVDGLEWKRDKWGRYGSLYYRKAETWAVRWSDALIVDAVGIADYYKDEFAVDTELISYGAPHVDPQPEPLAPLDLVPRGFHLVVARFEPENHVAEIVQGYVRSGATKPLVVVGGAPYASKYIAELHAKADPRVRFLGPVWDQALLDQLYANAFVYWHGHSVGGTNPSLLRAIGASAATNAFDVSFNREVLRESGRFWSRPAEVTRLLEEAEQQPAATAERGRMAQSEAARYDWDDVAQDYERLCLRLATPGRKQGRSASRDSSAAVRV